MKTHFNVIKIDLQSTGFVQNATLSNNQMLQLGSNTGDFVWEGKDPSKQVLIKSYQVDKLSTLSIEDIDRNNNENRSRDNRYNWKRNDQDSHSSDTHYSVNDHALFNIIKSPQLVENPTGEEGGTVDLDSTYIIIMYYLT